MIFEFLHRMSRLKRVVQGLSCVLVFRVVLITTFLLLRGAASCGHANVIIFEIPDQTFTASRTTHFLVCLEVIVSHEVVSGPRDMLRGRLRSSYFLLFHPEEYLLFV